MKVKDIKQKQKRIDDILFGLKRCIYDHGVYEIDASFMQDIEDFLQDTRDVYSKVIDNSKTF